MRMHAEAPNMCMRMHAVALNICVCMHAEAPNMCMHMGAEALDMCMRMHAEALPLNVRNPPCVCAGVAAPGGCRCGHLLPVRPARPVVPLLLPQLPAPGGVPARMGLALPPTQLHRAFQGG